MSRNRRWTAMIAMALLGVMVISCTAQDEAALDEPVTAIVQPAASTSEPAATQLATTSAPEPTATLQPGEIIATQMSDLVGVWVSSEIPSGYGRLYIQFNDDGTLLVDYQVDRNGEEVSVVPSPNLDEVKVRATYWFEGTEMYIQDVSARGGGWGWMGGDQEYVGRYEVRVLKNGDRPVKVRFIRIADDYQTRAYALTSGLTGKPWAWVSP